MPRICNNPCFEIFKDTAIDFKRLSHSQDTIYLLAMSASSMAARGSRKQNLIPQISFVNDKKIINIRVGPLKY